MAQRPAFGALKKIKPTLESDPVADLPPPAAAPKVDSRIQTSVRLDLDRWAALNELATRKRAECGRRVTVHDLMIEGVDHILALNGISASR